MRCGTLDGASDLTVTGDAVFNGQVGGTTALTSVHVTGSSALGTDLIVTSNAQSYDGAVSLQAASTNLQGSTVTFNGSLDGASDLTVTGDAVFNGQVGETTALTSLHVTGTSNINTSLVKTTGPQTYDGAVTTLPGTMLLGNPVTFNSTVNGSTVNQVLGFFSPIPNSKWKTGQTVPFKVASADANGVRLSDSAAAALLTPICRVKISSSTLPLTPTCMKYDSATDQFTFSVKLSKAGTQTVTVALSYPNFTVTKSVAFTVMK